MKTFVTGMLLLAGVTFGNAQPRTVEQRIDDLLAKMTLDEKVGQLNQYTDDGIVTGPVTNDPDKLNQIKRGEVGSLLNVIGVKRIREYQKVAMQSRLRIPLLFGQDVVHGYMTTFPIPLGEAASWDLPAMELSAHIAAVEASAGGINWTFAPMVDIARDARWGRVMEGAGEDPYFGSKVAEARVKGFQGNGLGNIDAVMACAKHFAAYGAAVGGRDYNSVDMSRRMLWETYLPPFKAAADAGVATFMNSFNDLNGVPASGNEYLMRDVLKGQWDYQGFVVSDWGSIAEMVPHGYAADASDAAFKAITAGSDMDMEGRCYKNNLAQLVKDGKVSMSVVDDAVRRVLRKKFELGLFDNPYKFCDEKREKAEQGNAAHRQAAREIGAKSIVLIKNEGNLLPISKDTKTIAFIGPLVKEHIANNGFWAVKLPSVDYDKFVVSQWDGVANKVGKNTKLLYAKGCEIEGTDTTGFQAAVEVARQADVVVMSVGERPDMSGEAKSRSDISIPGVQEELIKAVQATGKPVVVLINAGRPLVFNWTADHVPAILYTWWLGTEAGNSIADVLFGDVNPSAKLPMTFPRSVGQVPIYYNHYNTGRPAQNDNDRNYRSAYLDLPISPKFAFGHGLSYTTFGYSNFKISKPSTVLSSDMRIIVSVDVTNTGKRDGDEVVQLYLRDKVGEAVRPVKELKGFNKVRLAAGETKTITFPLTIKDLSYYHSGMSPNGTELQFSADPGDFDVMVGSASDDIRANGTFTLEPPFPD